MARLHGDNAAAIATLVAEQFGDEEDFESARNWDRVAALLRKY